MSTKISRRDFLKLGALALGGLAFNPFPAPQGDYDTASGMQGRVAYSGSVSVYKHPDDKSPIMFQRLQDEVFNIYYEVVSPSGPSWNPRWYRVWGGYVHSGYIQRVETHLNTPLSSIPKGSHQLCEVSVPYTQIYQYSSYEGWQMRRRLYYQTTHWVVGIDEGPDGEPWYRIYDELREDNYNVPATHLRPITAEELSPLSPEVSPYDKHIEVSLTRQTLQAFEGDKLVLDTRISSGVPNGRVPPEGTATPQGDFHIESKMPTKHMGDGVLTFGPGVYTLPGVPWTMFFTETGVALHGTYWHDNFGIPMSHGCVNMRIADAKWMFRWTTPTWPPKGEMYWELRGLGTAVHVA